MRDLGCLIFATMKIFKFGGASVSTVERIQNVAKILAQHRDEKILVVISAMGKTTNALEKVVEAFYEGEKTRALELFNAVRQQHKDLAQTLSDGPADYLNDFFTEAEWLLHDKPVRSYDYYYDQVVCVGELLSTAIISHYLNQSGIENTWIDVRDILRTDDTFRDARVDWNFTSGKVKNVIEPAFRHANLIVTQGFIGATDENESTTLGREGSDYTAAIFANLLNAESQTIWKDVPGVMNADPKQYSAAQWIRELSYREVIEMAYYGAQVIHPKTIKPLQNKNIPLYVRSFLQPDAEGTRISHKNTTGLPPIIVYKHNQVLMQFSSRDYSFVSEGLSADLFALFEEIRFKPNLMQNAAISMLCVVDDLSSKIEQLAHGAAAQFDVQITKGLTLLTIRHYTKEVFHELCGGGTIILQQQTPETVQVVLQNS
jgi:aspartate kinase